jgi:Tfp pilus assembly protein PilO
MENQSNQQKAMIFAALALLVAFLLIIFYIVPGVGDLKERATTVSNKKQQHDLGVSKVQAIRTAAQAIALAKKQVSLLGVAIPEMQNAEEAVLQISLASKDSSVAVKGISVGSTEVNGNTSSGALAISVSVTGEYPNIIKLTKALEKNLRPVTISNISISSADASNEVEAKFDLDFPYLGSTANTDGSEVINE